MASYGFPTLLQYSRLNNSVADIKLKTEQARTEMVTGRFADLKSELGATVGDAHLIRKTIDDIKAMQTAAKSALGRAQSSQVALSRSAEGVISTGASLLDAVGQNDQNSLRVAATEAELQLEGAISAFNTRYEGRSLFSGNGVDQTALADADTLLADIQTIFAGAADYAQLEADLDFYFNDPTGGFATTIYMGGDGDAARTEIADGELVSYSAKADEQPVRDLLRALSTAVVAHQSGSFVDREEALLAAGAEMIQAANDITSIRARIGAAEERIAAADTRLEAEAVAFSSTYNERTAVDPFEAASRLQALESQLEASYVVTSRISLLSLSNFLR